MNEGEFYGELTQLVLGLGVIALVYFAWRALSESRIGRILQVVVTSVMAAFAAGLAYFADQALVTSFRSLQGGNFGFAAYILLAGGRWKPSALKLLA